MSTTWSLAWWRPSSPSAAEELEAGGKPNNRRDFEAIRSVSDPNIEVDWSAFRSLEEGAYRGVEDVVGLYRTFFDTFEVVEIEAERFIDSGDSVVVPNTAYPRGRDGIATVARSAFVFELRGDRVARIRLYQGRQEALEAVGLPE